MKQARESRATNQGPIPLPFFLRPPQPGPASFVQQPLPVQRSLSTARPEEVDATDSEWEDIPQDGAPRDPQQESPEPSQPLSPEWNGVPLDSDEDSSIDALPPLPRPSFLDINPDEALRDLALLQSSRLRKPYFLCPEIFSD